MQSIIQHRAAPVTKQRPRRTRPGDDAMKGSFPSRAAAEPTSRELDLEFAEHAAEYLFRQGLSPDEVARALMEQCGLDSTTAYLMAV